MPKAVFVEEFNPILISRVTLRGFTLRMDVFVEKPGLLPFEEAKLYGHNAIHALIVCLAAHRGLTTMSDAAAARPAGACPCRLPGLRYTGLASA
jgi:mannitol-1-phosphate/altronate dehydrogenase